MEQINQSPAAICVNKSLKHMREYQVTLRSYFAKNVEVV